jgi:hypothetical protein
MSEGHRFWASPEQTCHLQVAALERRIVVLRIEENWIFCVFASEYKISESL